MSQYDYNQLQQLWIQAGGSPSSAPTAAAIALAESGGTSTALNSTAPDYSVGLWQVNYYGDLYGPRSAAYGSPIQLANDPLAQARAAVSISGNGADFSPWTTYTSGAYRQYLTGASGGSSSPSLGPSPASSVASVAPPKAVFMVGGLILAGALIYESFT